MRYCTIWGDMTSDRASENYPEVPVCEDCIEAYKGQEETIVSINGECADDDQCHFCEKTKTEEDEEVGEEAEEGDETDD